MTQGESLTTSPVPAGSWRGRLFRGLSWALAGAVVSRAFALLASIVVARLVGRESFGELGVIMSTVGMFQVFAGFGLGTTATKYVAQYRETDPLRAARVARLARVGAVVTGVAMAAGLFLLAPWLAAETLKSPQLTGLLRVGAAWLFLMAVNDAQTGLLAGFEAFGAIARANAAAGMLSFPLTVACAWQWGVTGAVWALVGTAAVTALLYRAALTREYARTGFLRRPEGWTREWPALLAFSVPAALAGALVAPANWLGVAMVVNHPGGYAEMGLFNAANQWRTAILFLPGALGFAALPLLTQLYAQDDRRRFARMLGANLGINGGVALMGAGAVVLFGGWIMRSYGSDFAGGRLVLALLAGSAVLMAVGSVVGSAITSSGRMWYGFAFNALWAVALVGGAWVLVPTRGAAGLALATLVAYGLHLLWQGGYLLTSVVPAGRRASAVRGEGAPTA